MARKFTARKLTASPFVDCKFLPKVAEQCFAAAERCVPSLAAVGLRELGNQYLALAARIVALGTKEQEALVPTDK